MAKGQPFSLDGFEKLPDGTYRKKSNPQPRDIKLPLPKDYTIPKEVISLLYQDNRILPKLLIKEKSILTIDGIISGLNGDKGLMRAHWSETRRMKNIYAEIIRIDMLNKKVHYHPGKVKIRYIGYKSILMDWDNFCSSFKHIGDALVEAKVIVDDKPSIVIEFKPEQIKCKRTDQKVVIIIEDIE